MTGRRGLQILIVAAGDRSSDFDEVVLCLTEVVSHGQIILLS